MTDVALQPPAAGVGALLRDWRQRRRRSQLDLALDAGVSARHVSFVETGRAKPSRDMVLHLADQLEVPLRERNRLLLAAGYAPVYGERSLDDPEMAPVREALELVLRGHEPYPAVVVDRGWNVVAGNRANPLLLESCAPELLGPPLNVLRVSLHPDGMAPRILNLGAWRAHLLERVERQVVLTGDAELARLGDEVAAYPGPDHGPSEVIGDIVVPLHLRTLGGDELRFFSTMATFGTAVDITVAELSIESFFPADEHTADVVRRHVAAAA
ncbi:MAG: helix-turn-helix domain-containing protein [Solirubrobacterales bacterium]